MHCNSNLSLCFPGYALVEFTIAEVEEWKSKVGKLEEKLAKLAIPKVETNKDQK